jgi:hypothetical protein
MSLQIISVFKISLNERRLSDSFSKLIELNMKDVESVKSH